MQFIPNHQPATQTHHKVSAQGDLKRKRSSILKWGCRTVIALTGIVLPPLLLPTLTLLGGNVRDAILSQNYQFPLSNREVKSICQAMFGRIEAYQTVCFSGPDLQNKVEAYLTQSALPYETLSQDHRVTVVSNQFVGAKCYGHQISLAEYHPCIKLLTDDSAASYDIIVVEFRPGEWSPVQQTETSRDTVPFIAVSGSFEEYDPTLKIVRLTDGKLESPVPVVVDTIAAVRY